MFDQNVIEAIEIVSAAWDVPDDDFAQVLNDHARLLARINQDEAWEDLPDIH